jgi:RNA polymerase sigma-32 factor
MSNPEERFMESQQTTLVKKKLGSAMDNLTPREQYIMKRRIMADRPDTLEDIGNMYAISKERVRQIENHSKLKLKKALAPSIELMMPS